ncbi:MAG TPA: hypothetical protein VH723_03765 [Candidatus Limnocylindrales bacterium]|jgi:hypothetical protein
MSRRSRRGHGAYNPRADRGPGDAGRSHRPYRGASRAAPGLSGPAAPTAPQTAPGFEAVPTVRQPTVAAAVPRPPSASDGDRVGLPPTQLTAPTNGHAETNGHVTNGHGSAESSSSTTAPQLRRFIKSRAYVPMHELRRRFGINGSEDDVTPVDLDGRRLFVGLPTREGVLLGELLRGGEIGYELSLDPCTPVVIGVYPMRPVPRH